MSSTRTGIARKTYGFAPDGRLIARDDVQGGWTVTDEPGVIRRFTTMDDACDYAQVPQDGLSDYLADVRTNGTATSAPEQAAAIVDGYESYVTPDDQPRDEPYRVVEVGRERAILPGVYVTPLQAVGHVVSYRATADVDNRTWPVFVATLPDSAQVTTDVLGHHATWSRRFPYVVREAVPCDGGHCRPGCAHDPGTVPSSTTYARQPLRGHHERAVLHRTGRHPPARLRWC